MFKKSGPSVSTTAYTLRRIQKIVAIGAAVLLVGGVGFYVSDRGSGTAHADQFPEEMEMPREYTNTADPFAPTSPVADEPTASTEGASIQPSLGDPAARANMGDFGDDDPCDPANAVGWGNIASGGDGTSPCDGGSGSDSCSGGGDDGTLNAVGWGNARAPECESGADI